ncbi:MAG TPA: UDP-forming cellulose synthase catalytic subunit [Blastocatellia bacterium]|nr:UDP-forming cellulose synthase catalytic subunit [Blastocatellia bacterium]
MSNNSINPHPSPPRPSLIDRITESLATTALGTIGLFIILPITLIIMVLFVVMPLTLGQQALLTAGLLLLAMLISVLAPRLRLLVMLLSLAASFRYIYWRASYTLSLGWWGDAIISILLFAAEIYGIIVLVLGYFQTLELNLRQPEPLPANEADWPTVDVYIPTYNEDEEILRRTVTGALAIEYPKKTVYLLDDGRRDNVKLLAEQLGCEYIIRSDNKHAKAGNINHALTVTNGELITILDADHVPVKSFLRETVGFFNNPNVALVQTPHHFYNPDPFERNLNVEGLIAPEGDFFYHVVQVGNDFWNSAFFCGSAGVIRRTALEEVGGIATETVTEDAHTSLRIHARGYRSFYYSKPLIAGLATERYAYHVGQRIRWARGMAQILRVQNPLFTRGLKLPQRLNYFNAMLHFLFGIPRLIFIIAPVTYLLFNLHPVKGLGLEVLLYALPHIALATIATSMVSRSFRHAFWAEVYESAIATYLSVVTLMALISPKFGKFNVTAKGGYIEKPEFDWKHAAPTLVLIAISLIAIFIFIPVKWLSLSGEHASIAINGVWVFYNLVILVAAALVARERPQQRRSPRISRKFACIIFLPGGEAVAGTTTDLSETGARVTIDRPIALPEIFTMQVDSDFGATAMLDAKVTWRELDGQGRMTFGCEFEDMDIPTSQDLIRLMFSGPDSWVERTIPPDRPFRSYWYIFSSPWRTMEERTIDSRRAPRIAMALPCRVITPSGRTFNGTTQDISETGAAIFLEGGAWPLPQEVRVQIRFRDGEEIDLPAQTVRPDLLPSGQLMVGVIFEGATYEDRRLLSQRLYNGHIAETFKASPPDRHRTTQLVPRDYGTALQTEVFPSEVPPPPYHETVDRTHPLNQEFWREQQHKEEEWGHTEVHEAHSTARTTSPVSEREYTEPLDVEEPTVYSAPLISAPLEEDRPITVVPEPHDSLIHYLENPPEEKIIANSRIGVYYVPGGDYYNQMLQASQRGGSSWVTFDTEEEAQEAGYRRPRAIMPPPRTAGNTSRREM